MLPESLAILIEEFCLRSLQRPSELRAFPFTRVNLVALGMNLEENTFPRRRSLPVIFPKGLSMAANS